jgi:hypothetical protein
MRGIHPKDEGAAPHLRRRVGPAAWKLAAIAAADPKALDGEPEETVRKVVLARLEQAPGVAYLNLRESLYGWLKQQIIRDPKAWQPKALLHELKDLQDVVAFRRAPDGWPCCLALPLELKRARGGKASPGQESLAAKVGGVIAHGVEPALSAVESFLDFKP